VVVLEDDVGGNLAADDLVENRLGHGRLQRFAQRMPVPLGAL
jgi:hypothetical protein